MATQESLVIQGTQLLWADHATDFGSAPATANNSLIRGTATDIQIDLTGVAAAAARQSAKSATLARTGSAFPRVWAFRGCFEFETAPAAGGTVELWWSSSPSATAAVGNKGNASGVDAAFTVGPEDQMLYIGTLRLRNDVINIGEVGTLLLNDLFGSLIVINKGSTAFRSTATAMDETHIVADPLIDDLQAAA